MTTWLNDLRYALRQLRRSPGFTAVAILTLALGIGAVTAIFTLVDAVLLRPLPFPHSSQLVSLYENAGGAAQRSALAAPHVLALERNASAFSHLGAYQTLMVELSGSGEPAEVDAARTTAGVFPALGVQPLLGRVFTAEEDEQGNPVLVVSYAFWQKQFHGDPHVLGKTVDLDRKPYTIVGVMPRSFEFPLLPGSLDQVSLWKPMSFTPAEKVNEVGNWNYSIVARMKPGIGVSQATADVDHVLEDAYRSSPLLNKVFTGLSATGVSLQQETIQTARPLLRLLFFAVLVLLLIACANLAGLLLVRAIRKRRETAVRLALGAPGAVLVRQSLLESILISVCGGTLGAILAVSTLHLWVALLPESLPRMTEIHVNWTVLGFAIAAMLLTGLLCGAAPALATLHTDPGECLQESSRTSGASFGHARLRSLLVIGEIAAAMVLLAAGGLLLRSYENLRAVDLGFRPDHTLTAYISLPPKQYAAQQEIDTFHRELVQRLRQVPGVKFAALATAVPLEGWGTANGFTARGYTPASGVSMDMTSAAYLVGDYFRAMGIHLLRGRTLTPADGATDAPLSIVVNRTLAEKYWHGQNPVGKQLKWGPADYQPALPWMTVVGEVEDIRQQGPEKAPMPEVYLPASRIEASLGSFAKTLAIEDSGIYLAVRSGQSAESLENAIRRSVWSLDPRLAITDVQTMRQVVDGSTSPQRFETTIFLAFAASAVGLAVLGLYGIIAFSVARRTREMAIRIALGANKRDVLLMVLRSGLKLGIAGVVLGLAGAFAATRLLTALLFGVRPFDPAVLVAAGTFILLISVAASVLPARRAASVDPMQALRNE